MDRNALLSKLSRPVLWVAALLLTGLSGAEVGAQPERFEPLFQFAVPAERGEKGASTAFLWIPPESERIRGALVSGMTSMERQMSKDKIIREACAEQDLAIVFLKTGLGSVDIQQVLDDLAAESGYAELAHAPLFFAGHSAGGPQARRLTGKMSERCFGIALSRGGGPWGEEGDLDPAIPSLMLVGQFDEFGGTMRDENGREAWQRVMDAVRSYRQRNPESRLSIVIEPGAGHFAWSKRNAEYLALFLSKAAESQIPEDAAGDGPVGLKRVAAADGWATDLDLTSEDRHGPAAWDDFGGEATNASWHFDRELARASERFQQGLDKKDQFIEWEDRYWVDAGTRFFFLNPQWVDDGRTIQTHPVYAETYPKQHNGRGPKWLKAGEPVGHSDAPIKLRIVGGGLTPIGDHKLRVQFDALAPAGERDRMTFLAYSEGDETYRYTERVGMMPRGFKGLDKGKDQTITFAPLDDVTVDSGPIELTASSSADLPVAFYIGWGPAKIVDGRVVLDQIPAGSKFPIEVKVVAYQFGRGIEPRVKTADPVEHTFQITR